MIKKILTPEKIDKLGVSLSTICLVHCLLLPVLLATVPCLAFLSFFRQPLAEALLIIFAISNAILSVTSGFKKHRNFIVPASFISGSIMLSFFFFAHHVVEQNEYIILTGASLIGLGHVLNTYLCNKCSKCNNE